MANHELFIISYYNTIKKLGKWYNGGKFKFKDYKKYGS